MIPTSVFITAVYHLCSPAHACQRLSDGLRIGVTHQFADVLSLPTEGAAGFYSAGVKNRGAKVVVQRQRHDVCLPEADQFLAKFLQRQILAFLGAFAGLCLGHRLKYPAAVVENAGV